MDLTRIMGVIALNASTYREIADDPNATRPAGIIVAVVALIAGFSQGLFNTSANWTGAIITAIVAVILGLIAWFIGSWVLAFVSRWFGGKTNTREMLRVTGFVEVFNIISVLLIAATFYPLLACITLPVLFVVAILRLIGYIVGVREAAEFSTGNAIVTAIVALIIVIIITVVLGGAVVGLLGFGAPSLGGLLPQ